MKAISIIACAGLGLFISSPVWAENDNTGEKLYKENCTACHIQMTGGDGSTLFTRKDRKVKSMDSLKTQILRCATGQNLAWFDEDVDAVASYLNEQYYQFDAE